MTMEYIRKAYNVPAKRGGRIRYQEREGVILGQTCGRLRVRLDGTDITTLLHPTWRVEYLPEPPESGEGSVG